MSRTAAGHVDVGRAGGAVPPDGRPRGPGAPGGPGAAGAGGAATGRVSAVGSGRRLRALRTPPRGRGGPSSAAVTREPDGDREVPVPVLLDLLEAASASGAGVPHALATVGAAAGGRRGAALVAAAGAVQLGASWGAAWAATPAELAPVAEALRGAWVEGAPAGPALRASADALRRDAHARDLEAAARLGVRLVVPLGLCHLPAFVLVGLGPVLLAMARSGLAP